MDFFNLFLSYLSVPIGASVLLVMFVVFRRILERHMTARGLYLILYVVMLRLLIPFSPPLELGLEFNFMDLRSEYTSVGYSAATDYGELQAESSTKPESPIDENAAENLPSNNLHGPKQSIEKSKGNFKIPWLNIITAVWIIGASVKLGLNLCAYFVYRRKVLYSAEDYEYGSAILAQIAQSRRCPRVLMSREVRSPMVMGLIKPTIILPKLSCTDVDLNNSENTENILRHEYCHYRRGDIWIKWLAMAAFSLHWFNPIMIAVDKLLSEYCELSCDESVTQDMDLAARKSYIRTIIRVMENNLGSQNSNSLPVTAMSGSAKKINKRLECIANMKKMTFKRVALSVIAVIITAALGALLGACADNITGNSENDGSNEAVSQSDVQDMNVRPLNPNATIEPMDFSNVEDREYPITDVDCLTLQQALYSFNYARSYIDDPDSTYGWCDKFVEANPVIVTYFGNLTPCEKWLNESWHSLPFHNEDEEYFSGETSPAWEIKLLDTHSEAGFPDSFFVSAITGDIYEASNSGGYCPSPYVSRSKFAQLYKTRANLVGVDGIPIE